MNKLIDMFEEKKNNILSIYFTAGYPKLSDTVKIIRSLKKAGADMVEVGFPFSDPMADGPVIQKSSHIALSNGMNLDILFDQLKSIKESVEIPLIMMGYLNPAYKYGMEKFCRCCSEAGVSGLIIPDLPNEIYEAEYKYLYDKYNLCYIPLITPQTSEERIEKLGAAAKGFVYMVSSSIITGGKSILTDHSAYFSRVRNLLPDKPLLIGFGISDAATFSDACKNANGGIIGTAFIRLFDEGGISIEEQIQRFVSSIRN
jgi:tryptophan synthase alpha chain